MGRPSKEIKRTIKITITLTFLEHLLLQEVSKKIGIRKSVLSRQLVTDFLNNRKTKFKVVPQEVKEAKWHLYKIGNNLNQIAKGINTDKQVTVSKQHYFDKAIKEALEVLKDILNKL